MRGQWRSVPIANHVKEYIFKSMKAQDIRKTCIPVDHEYSQLY
jgi:hypothetical protein